MMKMRREIAPPAPFDSALVLKTSKRMGMNPETTATTTKLRALLDRNAISMAAKQRRIRESPIS